MKILISACLLGLACRYDGNSKPHPKALALAKGPGVQLIPFCPECYGGLPTPRPPAEQRQGKVTNAAGADVTAQYQKGAQEALRLCRTLGCEKALLKARSPSCGCGEIYDGSFTGTLIPGNGITADLLLQNNIEVITEEDL